MTVWAILKEIGADGMRDRVCRHNSYARRVAELASHDDELELLSEPTLSICCFRYNGGDGRNTDLDALNAEIARRLRAERGLVPSTTKVGTALAIRPCYINPRTTLNEVEDLVRGVKKLGRELNLQDQPEVSAASHPALGGQCPTGLKAVGCLSSIVATRRLAQGG